MISADLIAELEMGIRRLSEERDHTTGDRSFSNQRSELIERTIANLTPEEKRQIIEEFDGWGPLELLLSKPHITEIILNGPQSIWYEESGRLHKADTDYLSAANYCRMLTRLMDEANCHPTVERPSADGKWRAYRLHVTAPPISGMYPIATLRSHPECPWTLPRLMEQDWCTPEQAQVLRSVVNNRENFLVIGSTGSGKTSVLNALMTECSGDRVVALEDSPELRLPCGPSLRLLTRHDSNGQLPDVSLTDLLRQSLRLRPDRLAVGEIRGGEAKDYLMALSTGHAGSFGTLHADHPEQALLRLEMLVQMGAPQWSLATIRRLIRISLQVIITTGRKADGRRTLKGIHRIVSLEESGFILEAVLPGESASTGGRPTREHDLHSEVRWPMAMAR